MDQVASPDMSKNKWLGLLYAVQVTSQSRGDKAQSPVHSPVTYGL